MRIRRCGTTGFRVSELGLGTLTWGRDTDAPEAIDMIRAFVDAGGTLLEGAPWHGDGLASDVIGDALQTVGRQRITIVWRGAARLDSSGKFISSSGRGDMLLSLDRTLAKFNTDYVDMWLATPDPEVHLDETLSALDAAWRSGRAHYVGLAGMSTWSSATALARSQSLFAGSEQEYSLLAREGERELIPALVDAGIGIFAHSPLAGGVLTGKYRNSTPPDSRAASPHLNYLVEPHLIPHKLRIVEAVARAAQGLDRTTLDVALTWVRDAPGVTSAIIGPRNLRQLNQILSGGEPLPQEIRAVLNEVSTE